MRGDRAIADTACQVYTFAKLDGIEVSVVSFTRLLWRVQRPRFRWSIAGLRGIYIRDMLVPAGPGPVLKLDDKKLARYRPSYRYLSYVLAAGGRPAVADLPELVTALRTAERTWLEQA